MIDDLTLEQQHKGTGKTLNMNVKNKYWNNIQKVENESSIVEREFMMMIIVC